MKKQLDPAHAPFEPAINHWPKVSGAVPAPELFTQLAGLGMNMTPGRNKHSLACAMYLRPEGATDREVVAAAVLLNPPHMRKGKQDVLHNYAFHRDTGLCGAAGLCKRVIVDARDGRKVLKMVLTAKGEKQVARYQAAQAAAPAVAPKGKAKKAKARKPRAPKAVDAPVIAGDAPLSPDSVLIPADSN